MLAIRAPWPQHLKEPDGPAGDRADFSKRLSRRIRASIQSGSMPTARAARRLAAATRG